MLNRPSIKESVFLLAEARDMLYVYEKYCSELPPNSLISDIQSQVTLLSNALASQVLSEIKGVLMTFGNELKKINGSFPAKIAIFLQKNPILSKIGGSIGEKNTDYLNAMLFRVPTVFDQYIKEMTQLANDQKLTEDNAILLGGMREQLNASLLSKLSEPMADDTMVEVYEKLQNQLTTLVKGKHHRAFGLIDNMYTCFLDDLLKTDSRIKGFDETEQVLISQAIQHHYHFSIGVAMLPPRLVKAVSDLRQIKQVYSISIYDLSEFLTQRLTHIADFLNIRYKSDSQFYRTYEGLVSATLAQEDINKFIRSDNSLRINSASFDSYRARLESYFQIPMRFSMPIGEMYTFYEKLAELGVLDTVIQSPTSKPGENVDRKDAVTKAAELVRNIKVILHMKTLGLNFAMDACGFIDSINRTIKDLAEDQKKSIFTSKYSAAEIRDLTACLGSIQSYLTNISGSERTENSSNFNCILAELACRVTEYGFDLSKIEKDKSPKPAFKLLLDICRSYEKRLKDAGWHVEAPKAPVASSSSPL
ncbi:MAG: hypothetical protein ACYC0J_01625 [Gammaproteobacteria bacterium]